MSKFYLLDHSLKNHGGHHCDYARCVLTAAENAGFAIVLATHRKFRHGPSLSPNWRTFPVFSHTTYSPYGVSCGWQGGAIGLQGEILTADLPDPADGATSRRDSPWQRFWRRRRIEAFAKACETVFHQSPISSGDHVFLPTVSEFDLLGLVRYLQRDPHPTAAAAWHLQFHFNVLEGREPEYEQQPYRIAALRQQFGEALRHVGGQRLHFYATTAQLADQFNRLGVAEFQPLPYPIDGVFRPASAPRSAGPLRVTVAGAVRPEKGQTFLGSLVRELWEDFSRGQLQLVIQCKRSRWSSRPRRIVALPELAAAAVFRGVAETCQDKVVHVRHPASAEDYRQLIRRADVGLLLYDSRRYYTRHAGVLGEYLSSGVPVIVLAGGWLASQMQAAIDDYLEHVAAQAIGREAGSGGSGSAGSAEILASVTATGWEVALPAPAGDCLLAVRPRQPLPRGCYLQLTIDQFGRSDESQHRARTILSQTHPERPLRSLVHLVPGAERLELKISDAYGSSPIEIGSLVATLLNGARTLGGSFPAGQVGLIAAGPDQVPDLLRDLHRHHQHYRVTATRFAELWRARHLPERTLQQLLARAGDANRHAAMSGVPVPHVTTASPCRQPAMRS